MHDISMRMIIQPLLAMTQLSFSERISRFYAIYIITVLVLLFFFCSKSLFFAGRYGIQAAFPQFYSGDWKLATGQALLYTWDFFASLVFFIGHAIAYARLRKHARGGKV